MTWLPANLHQAGEMTQNVLNSTSYHFKWIQSKADVYGHWKCCHWRVPVLPPPTPKHSAQTVYELLPNWSRDQRESVNSKHHPPPHCCRHQRYNHSPAFWKSQQPWQLLDGVPASWAVFQPRQAREQTECQNSNTTRSHKHKHLCGGGVQLIKH